MQLIPCKRIGEPEDIVQVVVWLASDDVDYFNGISLFIDGGYCTLSRLRHRGLSMRLLQPPFPRWLLPKSTVKTVLSPATAMAGRP